VPDWVFAQVSSAGCGAGACGGTAARFGVCTRAPMTTTIC